VSVVVDVPAGVSLVLLKTDPAPTSAEDAIVLSRLEVARTTDAAKLHAVQQGADPGF
jgi:hypothetical protein